ncbi:MAG: sugar transferase [Candidatus Omnitrophica bacterium]|nr:sugar transferase [Candidatus Omnitrophota bacterium]
MRRPYLLIKRSADIIAASVLLLLFSPLFIILGLLIGMDSGAPVFFRQTRIGRNGRRFNIYKFRTMREGADRSQDQYADLNEWPRPLFKVRNDPRLTRIGALLRDTNLDELPQLLNVLKGDMSLIGPRPFQANEVDLSDRRQRGRLEILPGMVSLWHVSGQYRQGMSFDEWMESDLRYARDISLFLDAQILLRTIRMLGRHIILKFSLR